MKILVSSFEPFLEAKTNSSLMLTQKLALDEQNKDIEFFHSVPVRYKSLWDFYKKKLDEIKPDLVLALGQAENAKSVVLERWGLNWIEARVKDNDGVIITGQEISAGSPPAIRTKIEIESLYEKLLDAKIPVHISVSAGGFLCNYLYYHLLKEKVNALFVHVPLNTDQKDLCFNGMNRVSIDTVCRGVQIIINSLR